MRRSNLILQYDLCLTVTSMSNDLPIKIIMIMNRFSKHLINVAI